MGEGPVGIGRGEEEGFGAEEGGVAGGGDLVDGEGEEADTDGAHAVDVVPEGTGEVDMGDGAEVVGEEVEAGGDGTFGELEFADIALSEGDRGLEFPGLAGGEFSIGEDMAELEAGGDGVDEAAAADAAWGLVADDVTGPIWWGGIDLGDGAGGGAHAVGDAGAFEGGAGGGAGADELVAVAGDDFAVGAEVDEGLDGVLLLDAGDVESGEDIATDEAAEAGQEADLGGGGQGPLKVIG